MTWILLALACHKPATTETDAPVRDDIDAPVVIWWTIDTLGERAADTTGFCELLDAELGAYGLEVDCMGGAVAPSSWTAESHTRFLWPEHHAGALRAGQSPSCDAISVLEAAKLQHDLKFVWAGDNPVFHWPIVGGELKCDDGSWVWGHGADLAYEPTAGFATMLLDEADTPVHAGIGTLLDYSAEGGAVAFLNDFEDGGHWPRCFTDPYTEPCNALWELGISEGLVDADDDRFEMWWRVDFETTIQRMAIAAWGDDPGVLRGTMWATMEQNISYFREDRFLPRLRRLLAGLEEQDRLDDLTLVLTGDHGENPCVKTPVEGGMNCEHFGLPSEWSARVPVAVSPPALAQHLRDTGLAGDRDTPWALTNVSYGLLEYLGGEIPSSWPGPDPVGTAHSWTCRNGTETALHVSGDASLRCEAAACGAFDWTYPEDIVHEPLAIPTPDDLAVYGEPVGEEANWITATCP